MKIICLSILIICAVCSFNSFSITKEEALENFVNNYPKAQLTDIYKSFYQDNFGPGHLLGDTIAASNYFYSELEEQTQWGGPIFEFTGEGKNFIRLNMDLVRNGDISAEDYFRAFQNSLGRVDQPSDEYWISEWTNIDSIINSKGYHFINESNDREFIKEKLASRNFPIHHSNNFNENYNFHYRIISLPEFYKLKEKYPSLNRALPKFSFTSQNENNLPLHKK